MKIRCGILILALSFASGKVVADRWTNAAGHGIDATLIALENGTVTLLRPQGKPFTMKLTSFCASDQIRIRRHFGLKAEPELPSAADLAYEKQLSRLRQLYVAGKMDDEEFRKKQSALLNHFYGNRGQPVHCIISTGKGRNLK